MRRTNRREAWKDKQEKIRLGLEPPPEPKVGERGMAGLAGGMGDWETEGLARTSNEERRGVGSLAGLLNQVDLA